MSTIKAFIGRNEICINIHALIAFGTETEITLLLYILNLWHNYYIALMSL